MTKSKQINIAFSEVNYIISKMKKELQIKIPDNVKNNISNHMDKEFIYDGKAELTPYGKAILSVIISRYLADEEYKEKFIQFDNFCYIKMEEERRKKSNNQ